MKANDKDRHLIYVGDIISAMETLIPYENKKPIDIASIEQLGIERAFEIIGEASKRLDKSSFYEKYPEVEWSEMAKNRDFISHHYDDIELKTLIRTIRISVKKNLPLLKNILENEK